MAPSVPGNARAANESSGLSQRLLFPSPIEATKASQRPSGERANDSSKTAFSGGLTVKRKLWRLTRGWRK